MPGRVISISSDGVAGGVARGAAKELGALGITVNAVDPGRLADTAALVSLLCSDAGGWITGQVLHSGGGFALS
jgi:NAD(P)-dependent dehydrogenase (short-subunit alcohol dehydrogenase family)